MRFLDLFAGIGGFRLTLEQAGHKCIGFCEIDKFARQTYKANFDTEGEVDWEDITEVTDSEARELRGKVDLITGGFPCQAFSVAGHRRGFEDTRGTLFFDIARIAEQVQPRFLLLENVKGLLSHDKGETFGIILNTLDELGYDVEWQVLNSKDFGVPQNRERVFIIGHSRRFPRREVFPITGTSGQTIKQIGNIVDTDSFGGNPQRGRVYSPDGLSPTLNTVGGGGLEPKIVVPVLTPDRTNKGQNGRRFKTDGEPMFTLTSQDRHGVAVSYGKLIPRDIAMTIDAHYHKGFDNRGVRTGVMTRHTGVRIRRLTPLECFRLQGFPDKHFHNAKAVGVSDSQLYKQAGNAVTVNVVYEIAKRLSDEG